MRLEQQRGERRWIGIGQLAGTQRERLYAAAGSSDDSTSALLARAAADDLAHHLRRADRHELRHDHRVSRRQARAAYGQLVHAFLSSSKGYFNNTPCHRLTTAGIYVLQCGDPTGTGSGGPGYTHSGREPQAHATYPAGTVAMANTGQPHTGGSQFFFVYANTDLPRQYTPFGHVTAGLDVLQRIARAGSDNSNGAGDGRPLQPVVIESFAVTKG